MLQLKALQSKQADAYFLGLLVVLAETNEEHPLVSVEHPFCDHLRYLSIPNALLMLVILNLVNNDNLVALLHEKTCISIFWTLHESDV